MKNLILFENYQTCNCRPFSMHSKKSGDSVSVCGQEVQFKECLAWVKDRGANCLEFKGLIGEKEVVVKWDDGLDGYRIA